MKSCRCNNCNICVESRIPKAWILGTKKPKITQGEVRAVREMLHDLDLVLCEKPYHFTGSMRKCIIVLDDEFLLQFQFFFSSLCEQSFQNFTIIHRIGGLFLSSTSRWEPMVINNSTFVEKNDEHHFANKFSPTDLLLQRHLWGPQVVFYCFVWGKKHRGS